MHCVSWSFKNQLIPSRRPHNSIYFLHALMSKISSSTFDHQQHDSCSTISNHLMSNSISRYFSTNCLWLVEFLDTFQPVSDPFPYYPQFSMPEYEEESSHTVLSLVNVLQFLSTLSLFSKGWSDIWLWVHLHWHFDMSGRVDSMNR